MTSQKLILGNELDSVQLPSSKVQKASWPRVSIVVVNTNERHHLQRLLPSLFAQEYPDYEVLIVDNVSTDGSLEYVAEHFPQARIIRNSNNLGYAGANNVGFQHATGDFVAVLNPDTRVEPEWLNELINALQQDATAGLATPKILLMDDAERINTCGNEITYAGLTVCRGLDQPATSYNKQEVVPAVSGAAFVIRKSLLDEIGGFDEDFFIYYEETDLSLRARLAGYTSLYVPTSIVYHEYAFRFSTRKGFWQERNRYYSLLKTLRWRTFLALLPALLLGELISWGYVTLRGPSHMVSKLRAYAWVIKHWRHIRTARNRVQQLRRVRDRQILDGLSHRLNFAQTINPRVATVLTAIFNPLLFVTGNLGRILVTW